MGSEAFSLLQQGDVVKAASGIARRSEKQADIGQLERTFVDLGILDAIEGPNDQILIGRRGTGKSHVLQIVASRAAERDGSAGIYVDLRRLGSASMVTDPTIHPPVVAMGVFRDLMGEVQYALFDMATAPGAAPTEGTFEAVDELAKLITEASREVAEIEVEVEDATTSGDSAGVSATVGLKDASVGANVACASEQSGRTLERFTERVRETVDFAGMSKRLHQAVSGLGVDTLIVVIDEWSSMPLQVQPLLAEFIKHVLLPVGTVAVKMGCLEHRSLFGVRADSGSITGFELGGDIAADLDLDDFYVLDRAPDLVVQAFEELMYRHLDAELPDGYLRELGLGSAEKLRRELFTGPEAFAELVRAGEGVVRDFLNILGKALLRSKRLGKPKVDIRTVEDAAKEWFESDKSVTLSVKQREALRVIEEEVIGARRARSFLLDREASKHPVIQGLFDARLIHLTHRGYSDKENPGVRYNIYTLDYGTYVDLKRTKRQPELDFGGADGTEDEGERIVPFDDKRSIRRVVLDPAVLDRFVE